MSVETITVRLARDNKAVFIGYWAVLVRMEKTSKGLILSFPFIYI